MPFSVVGSVLLSPLLAALWNTHRRYQEVEAAERAAIAVDNAAIVFGRGGRQAFRTLRSWEARLRSLERGHHLVHRCPEPRCRSADVAFETALRSAFAAAQATAEIQWRGAGAAARAEATALDVAVDISGPSSLPVKARRCSFCGYAIGWESRDHPLRLFVRTHDGRRTGVSAVVAEETAGWQYRLAAADELAGPVP